MFTRRTRAGSDSARKSVAVATASSSEMTGADRGAQQAIGVVVVSILVNISTSVDTCQAPLTRR
jgi:hypothetical protein